LYDENITGEDFAGLLVDCSNVENNEAVMQFTA
jgi:prophage tail gpP-like protein